MAQAVRLAKKPTGKAIHTGQNFNDLSSLSGTTAVNILLQLGSQFLRAVPSSSSISTQARSGGGQRIESSLHMGEAFMG